VSRVGDGDTLDVRGGERVRLVQIDAPELGDGECYARQAHRALESLARPGSRVALEPDPLLDQEDRFGRLLRYVHSGVTNVNVELVRQGAATPYFLGGDEGRYADELLEAVAEARAADRGMWSACRVDWGSERPVATHPREVSLGRGTFGGGTQTFGAPSLDLKRVLRGADEAEL
jgi:endonuclease YncB( thermonuclease family)